jgi:hypothetical protein
MKKNHTPNTPRPGSGGPPDSSKTHVLPQLLELLEQSGATPVLSHTWSRKARAHLRGCASCRLGVNLLRDAIEASQPSDASDAAETSGPEPAAPHDGPENTDLALYISLASDSGAETADALLPQIAQHLATCPTCASEVQEALRDFADDEDWNGAPDDAVASAPVIVAPHGATQPHAAPAPFAQWLRLTNQAGEETHLLLAPYVIEVGDLTLNITSALPDAHITVERSDVPAFRASPTEASDDPARQGSKQEQSFLVDLRDDPATTSWVRVKIHLLPKATGRLVYHFTSYRVSSTDDVETRVGGVAWRLDEVPAEGEPTLLYAGETAPDEISKASSKARGDLRLTLRFGERDWIVPLIVEGPA